MCFYVTCIRPVTEYACQVFHDSLPQYLSEDLERIQRRALKIIFPDLDYTTALDACNLSTLYQRRKHLTESLFKEINDNDDHRLHSLLPPRNTSEKTLRRRRTYNIPICRTNRFKQSFIMYNSTQHIS